jgi:hypothetical protein
LKDLDASGGLDDLGNVITALNGTNFYDGMTELFECVEDPKNPICKKRESIPSKKDIVAIVSLMQKIGPLLPAVQGILAETIATSEGRMESIRDSIAGFNIASEFRSARLGLVTGIMKNLTLGQNDLRRVLLNDLFLPGVTEKSFLDSWVKDLSKQSFDRFVDFGTSERPNLHLDAMLISNILGTGVRCSDVGGKPIGLDLDSSIDEFMLKLTGPMGPLMDFVTDHVALLKVATDMCKDFIPIRRVVLGHPHKLDLADFMLETTDLIRNDQIKSVITRVTLKAKTSGFTHRDLIKTMSDPVIGNSLAILGVVGRQSPQFLDVLYDLLTSREGAAFSHVGKIIEKMLSKDWADEMKSLEKVWSFFKAEEKEFLFLFFDRHFDKGTNYINLLKFYVATLDLLKPVYHDLTSTYLGLNQDESIRALRDVARQLSGAEVLADFRGFFSRKHILNVIQVITRFAQFQASGLEGYRELVHQVETTTIGRASLGQASVLDPHIECLKEINEKRKNFGDLLARQLPLYCRQTNDASGLMSLLSEGISLENGYSHFVSSTREVAYENQGLFDEVGLFSEKQMGTSALLLKSLSDIWINDGGLEGFLRDLKDIFWNHENGKHIQMLEGTFSFLKKAMSKDFERKREWRNKAMQVAINKQAIEWESLSRVLPDMNAAWRLERGDIASPQTPRHPCEKFHSVDVGGIPCPSLSLVKNVARKVVADLLRMNKDAKQSALSALIDSVSPKGIPIPYSIDGDQQQRKRISISESMKMMHELTDPSRPVNNILVPFVGDSKSEIDYLAQDYPEIDTEEEDESNVLDSSADDDEKKRPLVKFNTMERVEAVVRDVRFDNNYLGAHYKNSVAKATNYDETVSSKKKMFSRCVGLKFCGKFMNKDERRLAKNAVAVFDGLKDVNTKENLKYGDYMQALLTALVSTSSEESQKSTIVKTRFLGLKIEIPWVQTKKQLLHHNGRILTNISMLSAFSNMARVVRDRIGDEPEAIDKFLARTDVSWVNQNLMKNIELDKFKIVVEDLLRILLETDGGKPLDALVELIYSLDYPESVALWEVVAKGLYLSQYFGAEAYLGDLAEKRYAGNDIARLLPALGPLLSNLPQIISVSKPEQWKRGLHGLNQLLDQFKKGLEGKETDLRGRYYRALNEAFGVVDTFVVQKFDALSGMDIVAEILTDANDTEMMMDALGGGIDFVDYLAKNNNRLESIFNFLDKLIAEGTWERLDFSTYLEMTTKKVICENENCRPNIHYDEPYTLVEYSLQIKNEQSGMRRFFDAIFNKWDQTIGRLLDRMAPRIILDP